MQPNVAEQCGNMAIFTSREVRGKGSFVVLVDLETPRAVGCEASPGRVIRHLAGLPSLSPTLKCKAGHRYRG